MTRPLAKRWDAAGGISFLVAAQTMGMRNATLATPVTPPWPQDRLHQGLAKKSLAGSLPGE